MIIRRHFKDPLIAELDWLAQKLVRLFERAPNIKHRNYEGSFERLLPAFYRGQIQLRMCRIGSEFFPREAFHCSHRESRAHVFMKRAAKNWMRANGATDAVEEARVYGQKRADVYSKSADWHIECGNTEADKLWDAILDEDHPRFHLIPYQRGVHPEREVTAKTLIAVEFLWEPELQASLEAWRLRRLREVTDFRNVDIAEDAGVLR